MKWPPTIPKGFPLTITDRGYMARIAGKPRWICGKKAPTDALVIYHRKAAALNAKQTPLPEVKAVDGIVTLHYVLNRWVLERRDDVALNRLSATAWTQYERSAKRINACAGHYVADDITPNHVRVIFNYIVGKHGADAGRRAMSHLRAGCHYAADMGWCRPVRLGKGIAKLAAAINDGMKWKLYTPEQVQKILKELDDTIATGGPRAITSLVQFKAMVLLALNGGYGAKELADLPRVVIDLDGARIDYSRGKTGASHVVPLWKETVEALRVVMTYRVGDELVFRTRQGTPWCVSAPKLSKGKIIGKRATDHVNERFQELVGRIGLKIDGQGFYKLKHLHCTTADQAGDPHATFALAGHDLPGAKQSYVAVGEDRLRKVVEFIHTQLLTPKADPPNK